jgi:hypothetical protein
MALKIDQFAAFLAPPTRKNRELAVHTSPVLDRVVETPQLVHGVPSRVVLEFGDAISGISRVSGQAARSIG